MIETADKVSDNGHEHWRDGAIREGKVCGRCFWRQAPMFIPMIMPPQVIKTKQQQQILVQLFICNCVDSDMHQCPVGGNHTCEHCKVQEITQVDVPDKIANRLKGVDKDAL